MTTVTLWRMHAEGIMNLLQSFEYVFYLKGKDNSNGKQMT